MAELLKQVGKALRIISDDDKKKIAIIIDGQTILPDFQITKLKDLKEALKEIGTTRAGKIISNRQVSQDDSDIIKSQGFQEEIVGSDVDIHLSLMALDYMNSKSIDIVGIGTTDSNLYPIFSRIKQDKELLIISWKKNITSAMESIADYILYIDYLD